jgi:PAS domain S-box-containing protein
MPSNFTGNFVEYCWEHTHPDDLLRVREEFAAALGSQKITDMEFRIITPDGEMRWISWKGDVKSDNLTGKKIAAGVNMDITGRKQAEETLQRDKEFFRAIFESSASFIHVLDKSGIITSTNKITLVITGFTEKELVGKSLRDFFTPASKELFDQSFPILMEKGQNRVEVEFVCKDGSILILDCSASALSDASGAIQSIVIFEKDITGQKKMEEALRDREKHYRLLAENSTDVIWTLDLDGFFTYVSPSVFQLRGYSPEEVMHQSLEEVISKGSLSIVQKMVQKTLETAKSGIEPPTVTVEVEQPCKDGSSVWTEVVSRLLYDASGKPEGFIGVSRNIAERKRAEELVETNRQLLQAVIDNSQYLIYAKDLEGRFIMVSQSLASFFGHPREQVMGKTSHDFLPKGIADQHRANDLDVLAKKSPVIIEEIAETADGIHTYLSTKFPLSDKEGTIYAVCGASIDITDRKRREEELKIKDFAIESSLNAIAFTDLQGNLTYVNQAFLSIMGYEDLQDVLNKSVISFWTSPDGAQIFEGIQKQGHWSGEIIGQRKDGTPIRVQVSINLIPDVSGRPIAMMGSFVDITERIRAEESVFKINQKLHVLSRLTREDLNNKILALNSYLDLTKIQLKRQESVTATLQKLELVAEQIGRINEYTKDYQDMGVNPPNGRT